MSFFTLSSPVMEFSSSRRVSTSLTGSALSEAVDLAGVCETGEALFGSALYLSSSGLGSMAYRFMDLRYLSSMRQ